MQIEKVQQTESGAEQHNTGLRVLSAGINTQLQDAGRKGYLFSGVSQCGFLDSRAAYIANRLCGNPVALPVIEIPWGGFIAVFEVNTVFAVCGAAVNVSINGDTVETWRSHRVCAGDEIKISAPMDGIWIYLAVRGGFQAKPVLGSVAGNSREKLGGFHRDGRAVESGDLLPCYSSQHTQCLALPFDPAFHDNQLVLDLRLIPGAQFDLLSRIQKRAVFNSSFILSKDYSRMGYKLTGDNRVLQNLPKITPDAIGYGAVQITPAGHPIVLLNDRQTLGGYCKIGSVISPDCHRLVQCRPDTRIRFQLIRPAMAQRLIKRYWSELMNLPLQLI